MRILKKISLNIGCKGNEIKLHITLFLFVFLPLASLGQVTTMFYGKDKVNSKNETAALYKVEIYGNNTQVTIELIPTKNRSRMNFWSSKNTVVKAGNLELPILGFFRNQNGEEIIDTSPFSGDWGWSNVKKGETFYYTMVFSGSIPPGVTDFTLVDRGIQQINAWGNYYNAHGYGFSNYTLNNPRKGGTTWSDYSIKKNIEENNDGICGIYESTQENGYRLGCVKQSGVYKLIYMSSMEKMSWWQMGDIKAELRPSATCGFFKAEWYMAKKTTNSNCYVIFDGGSMKTIIDNEETFYLKMYPSSSNTGITSNTTENWSGTGFALSDGYIVTNYHVVENAKSIKVKGIRGNFDTEYNATIVSSDKFYDLAIIKISDKTFNGFGNIPYRVKTSTSDVGEDIFVLGYPLTTTMGDEIKLTTGVISSKTGFQGDVSLYQISAPIQPGNSGGPLFDGSGNLIGIVNAKHKGTENVSYAIKSSYLNNLVESTLSLFQLPKNNLISGLSLSNKVKSLKKFTFMITCSNTGSTPNYTVGLSSSTATKTIEVPIVNRTTAERAIIKRVKLAKDYTAIEIIYNNQSGNLYFQWCSIDRNTYILANGTRFTMTRTDGIKIAPEKTYFSFAGQNITFTLYFPPIPDSTASIDLIESVESEWKWYGIKLN